MVLKIVLAALIATVNPLSASDLAVCIEDQTKMYADDVALYQRILIAAAKSQGLSLKDACSAKTVVRVTIALDAFGAEPSALGATRVEAGRILPEIYLFRNPIRRTLGSSLPALEVRAMVLVTLHELRHLTGQRHAHDSHGVFSAGFGRTQLLALSRDYQ
ncbi:MAG: hypothetical protein JNL98_00430 [Bryobacterales bacterium]|nr:hypothetical protein [Bryobacterales bacterium]